MRFRRYATCSFVYCLSGFVCSCCWSLPYSPLFSPLVLCFPDFPLRFLMVFLGEFLLLHSDRSLSFSPYSLLFRSVFAFLFLSCRIFPGVLIFGHALFIRSSQIFGGRGRQFFFYLFLLCAGGLGGRFLSGLFASGVVVLRPCSVFRSVLYSSYIQVYFSPGVCVPLWWAVVFRGCRLLYGMFSAAQPCPRFRVGKPHHVVVAVQGPPEFFFFFFSI